MLSITGDRADVTHVISMVALSPTRTYTMSSASRKLRIIAIPLTRPNPSRTLLHPKAKPGRLVYYQFQITVPVLPSIRLASGDQDSTITKKKGWLPEEGIAKWMANKAADIWAGFGEKKSGWKVCMICSLIAMQC